MEKLIFLAMMGFADVDFEDIIIEELVLCYLAQYSDGGVDELPA